MIPTKTHPDFTSLISLASITNDDQIITIGDKGTVDVYEPSFLTNTWTLFTAPNNYENLIQLFERIFYAMHIRQGYLAPNVKSALEGLKVLQKNQHDEVAQAALDKVTTYVQTQLNEWYNRPKLNLKPAVGDGLYSQLEQSCFVNSFESPTSIITKEAGVSWLIKKIDAFLKVAYNLSSQDENQLQHIKTALEEHSHKWTEIKSLFDSNSHKTYNEVKSLITSSIDAFVNSMEIQPPDVRQNIGLFIPFSFRLGNDGHAVTVNICQNKDNLFTINCCNAGFGGNIQSLGFNLNINNFVSLYGKPIQEYGPLKREEICAFLDRLQQTSINKATAEEASQAFKNLFKTFSEYDSGLEIPVRRMQVAGNCTTRSPLEWIIFCLQKYDNVALANHLLVVSPTRDHNSPDIALVEPLIPKKRLSQ